MDIFVLGCGGSLPLPFRHLTSVLIRRKGEFFLFDCGEGTQVSLRRNNLRWKNLRAIFLSHTHADHVTGLPGLLMLSSQVERQETLNIFGPPRTKQFISSMRSSLEMYINYPIHIEQIEPPLLKRVVFETEEYKISSFPVFHTRVAVGYCFEEKPRAGRFFPEKAQALGVPCGPDWGRLQRGEAVQLNNGLIVRPEQVLGEARAGRKVSFLTDSVYDERLIEAVRGSDLLICEGMYEHCLAKTAAEKGHMTAQQAALIAKKAQVERLGLIHFSPRYNNFQLTLLLDEAQKVFKNSFLCKDRQYLELQPAGESKTPNTGLSSGFNSKGDDFKIQRNSL